MKDEKGDLMLIHTVFNRQKNCFCHEVKKMRKTKIHTAKPLRPKPSAFEDEMATEKLKRYESQGIAN